MMKFATLLFLLGILIALFVKAYKAVDILMQDALIKACSVVFVVIIAYLYYLIATI